MVLARASDDVVQQKHCKLRLISRSHRVGAMASLAKSLRRCGKLATPSLVLCVLLLVQLHVGEAIRGRSLATISDDRVLTSSAIKAQLLQHEPSTLEEKKQDFLAWVESVGDRSRATAEMSVEADAAWMLASKAGGTVLTVNNGGGAQFTSIQAAVDTIPKHNSQRVVIQIAAGTYREKVFVPKNKPFVSFIGAGAGVTKITWHDTKSDTASGKTQDSATVGVNSEGFIAKGITFENSAPAPPPGAVGKQAVAFKIAGDKAAFYNCGFLGAQDTLYDDHGRHYFENCFIQGSIDFIFGDGQSLYKGCTLRTLSVNPGSLTAQKRSRPSSSTGFSFVNCKVDGAGALYLGRAWGAYSRVVFSYTYIGNVIIPQGWFNWGVPKREETVFYGQYKCSGPGAIEKGRVAWAHELTDAQAAPFQTISFIDGASWLSS